MSGFAQSLFAGLTLGALVFAAFHDVHAMVADCLTGRACARAQSPFANLTLGALFFAVVHEKRRPELGAFEEAIARGGEHAGLLQQYSALMQRCWSQDLAERPNFLTVRGADLSGLVRYRALPSLRDLIMHWLYTKVAKYA